MFSHTKIKKKKTEEKKKNNVWNRENGNCLVTTQSIQSNSTIDIWTQFTKLKFMNLRKSNKSNGISCLHSRFTFQYSKNVIVAVTFDKTGFYRMNLWVNQFLSKTNTIKKIDKKLIFSFNFKFMFFLNIPVNAHGGWTLSHQKKIKIKTQTVYIKKTLNTSRRHPYCN